MMNWILCALVALSALFAGLLGRMGELTSAALGSGAEALKFCIQIGGAVAVWSGVMRVAQSAGLCDKLAGAMAPLTRGLFPGLGESSARAVSSISMNMVANILGLGSAATPMALDAMAELDRINRRSRRASDYMVTLTVMNTASFQLIPTTVAAIRAAAGSVSPMDILPCVWLTSAAALACALCCTRIGNRLTKGGRGI